jgi:GH24 family phage-related lysozyme (muramidase)
MTPPLLRYALHTKADNSAHAAFWAAVEGMLTPAQRKQIEEGGDIRNSTWLRSTAPSGPVAAPTSPGTAVTIAMPLVKEFEGCKLTAYPDPETGGEPWTIGWGSTSLADNRPVRRGDIITQVQADSLLARRLLSDAQGLSGRIPGWERLTSNQQAALLSFTYNCGPNWYGIKAFATLTRTLELGLQGDSRELARVPAAMMLYVNPGGPSEAGLRRRRKAEGALWNAA